MERSVSPSKMANTRIRAFPRSMFGVRAEFRFHRTRRNMLYDELNGCYGSRKHRPNTWNTHFFFRRNKYPTEISISWGPSASEPHSMCRIRILKLKSMRTARALNVNYLTGSCGQTLIGCNWNGWLDAHDGNNQIPFALKSICQFSQRFQCGVRGPVYLYIYLYSRLVSVFEYYVDVFTNPVLWEVNIVSTLNTVFLSHTEVSIPPFQVCLLELNINVVIPPHHIFTVHCLLVDIPCTRLWTYLYPSYMALWVVRYSYLWK